MPRFVTLEEFHLTVSVPRAAPDARAAAARRVLNSRRFRTRLRAAVAGLMRRHPALAPVRVTVSR